MAQRALLGVLLLVTTVLAACGEAAPTPPGPVGTGTGSGSLPVAAGNWKAPCTVDTDCNGGGERCTAGLCEAPSAQSPDGKATDDDGWQPAGGGSSGSGNSGGGGGNSAQGGGACTEDFDCPLSEFCDVNTDTCTPYDTTGSTGGGSGGGGGGGNTGSQCLDDFDCPIDLVCQSGQCQVTGDGSCFDDYDCNDYYYCDFGVCEPI